MDLHWRTSTHSHIVNLTDVYENVFMGHRSLLVVMEWERECRIWWSKGGVIRYLHLMSGRVEERKEGRERGREGRNEGRIEGRRVDGRGCVFTSGNGVVRGVEGERLKRVE